MSVTTRIVLRSSPASTTNTVPPPSHYSLTASHQSRHVSCTAAAVHQLLVNQHFGLRKVARFFPVQSVTSLVGVHTCRIMLDGGPRALLRVLTAPSKVIKFVV